MEPLKLNLKLDFMINILFAFCRNKRFIVTKKWLNEYNNSRTWNILTSKAGQLTICNQ